MIRGDAVDTRAFRTAVADAEPKSPGTRSLWMDTEAEPIYPVLNGHVTADVCVVGGGISGLTAAYFLAKAGRHVVVIDAGGGETRRTTAHLTCALDDRFTTLERYHGAEGARLAARSHAFAIDLIERVVREEGIDCGFERVNGFLLAASAKDRLLLRDELAAAQRAGLDGVTAVPAPLGNEDALALCFPDQAQMHPLRYVKGLISAIERHGGGLYHARAAAIADNGTRGVRTTSGFRIGCERVVVATNTPMQERYALNAKQLAYRTYVVGVLIPKGLVPHALYWDTADPYHYVRVAAGPEPGVEVLLVGGEDHRTGEPADGPVRFARLEAWARARFAGLGEVRWSWSGQVMEPVDSLAFVGRGPGPDDGAFIIIGDGGNGMTHGTLGGRLVADQIRGVSVEWEDLYNPRHRSLRAAGQVAREGLHVVAKYGAHLSPGDVASRKDIAPGAGAVVRDGLSKVAVYRDDDGVLHERSAYCTHLGCVVQWNGTERSWDCPCHGSRFAVDGSVLNGPAVAPLSAKEGAGALAPFREHLRR